MGDERRTGHEPPEPSGPAGAGLRLLRPYLARQWPALTTAALSTVLVTAAELARPFPLKLVIDRLLDGRRAPFSLSSADVTLLAGLAVLVLGIAAADALGSYVSEIRLKRAGERITHDLRTATHAHLQRLSLAFHERRHTGDLVTRVTGDVSAVGNLFSDSIGNVAQAVLLLIGMLVVSFVIDPALALAAFAVTPVLAVVTFRFRRRLRAAARRQRRQEGEIAALTNETLGAARVVKAFGAERYEHDRLRERSERRQRSGVELSRLESRFAGVIDTLGAVGTALVLVIGVVRVARGAISPGDLVVMTSYVRRVYSPLRVIAREAGRMSRAAARAERVAEVLASDEVLAERPNAYAGPRARGDLAFVSASFAYEPGRPVLSELSLRVPAGQRVAVIGRSGAGKSTLAALVARFYDVSGGRVEIDGRDVRECRLAWLRDQVGLVLQDTVLFTGTVADNIAYGLDATREQVEVAAKAAGAHAFVSELPEGYDTPLGPRGVGLSGGQRQRIAIARTLLRDPPLLVLDEPTTGLDVRSEAEVIAGLGVLMRDRTTLIITHSLDLARRSERVVMIEDGRVTREGPPADLLAGDDPFGELDGRAAPAPPRPAPATAPPDPALPAMGRLLDAEAMAPVLRRTLEEGAPEPDVRVRRVRYRPREQLTAHYDVGIGGRWHGAVAMIAAGADLRRVAAREESRRLARLVDGRAPGPSPLAFDPDLGALIQWLPLDLSLPALALPGHELRRRLGRVDWRLGEWGPDPALERYRPRRRAVLSLDGRIVNLYAEERDFAAAVTGLEAARRLRGVRAPELRGVVADLRATVQVRPRGRPPAGALDAAREAGEALAAIHASPAAGLRARPPERELEAAREAAGLAAAVAPHLAGRLGALVRDLAGAIPPAGPLLTSHGAFHAGQLLDRHGRPAVVGVESICRAPAALDVASYAARTVRGDESDLGEAHATIEELLEGYGDRPADLSWHLAAAIVRRAPFPFRYLDDRWVARIESIVEAADSALRRS